MTTHGSTITAARALRPTQSDPIRLRPSEARSIGWRDLGIRFAFGFVVSVAAGLVGTIVGPSAGGMFLAFPAILPATLTLIDEKDGKRSAEADALGAVLGSAALAVFGIVSWLLLPRTEPVLAELAALAAWLGASVAAYLLLRRLTMRR